MGKKASLSIAQRSKIVTLHGEGYSQRKISEKCCEPQGSADSNQKF